MPRINYTETRCQKILEILAVEPATSVSALSTTLGVSKETIRKDLQHLAGNGKVTRIHGGVALAESATNRLYAVRRGQDADSKRQIAAAACRLIEPGDTVIIESSTTNLLLCEELLSSGKLEKVTLITNSLYIAQRIESNSKCQMLLLGGRVDVEEGRTHGNMTVNMLRNFQADKAFISAAALNRQMFITAYRENDMLFQSQAIACAEKTYVLANKRKFPTSALFSVHSVYELAGIISDISFDEKILEQFAQRNIEYIQP